MSSLISGFMPNFSPAASAADIAAKYLMLTQRTVLTLSHQNRVTIFCRTGEIWVTVPNDAIDYILHTGMSVSVDARHACVLEAVQNSTLTIEAEIPETPGISWRALLRNVMKAITHKK